MDRLPCSRLHNSIQWLGTAPGGRDGHAGFMHNEEVQNESMHQNAGLSWHSRHTQGLPAAVWAHTAIPLRQQNETGCRNNARPKQIPGFRSERNEATWHTSAPRAAPNLEGCARADRSPGTAGVTRLRVSGRANGLTQKLPEKGQSNKIWDEAQLLFAKAQNESIHHNLEFIFSCRSRHKKSVSRVPYIFELFSPHST